MSRRYLGCCGLRAVLAIAALLLFACGEEDALVGSNVRAPVVAVAASAAGAAAAGAATKEKEPLVYTDEDFIESLTNRDPFRTYSTAFRAKEPDELQRRVVMPATAVEDMTLIAIITGIPRPKAMLVDPSGVGYVIERGDFVGRPKVVQATGSVSMALNWRVDRIRENEVVLTQQDPTDPTRAGSTKIIPLRTEVAQN